MDCSNPECIKLQKEVERLRSTGYDMLKQTGRWQSCGATPEDLSRKFQEFFDHEVYDMTETLQESAQVNENAAREMLSTAVQESYEVCRAAILSDLMKTLERVVSVDVSTSRTSIDDEELYDANRAYGLLLSASGLADNKSCRFKEVSKQVRDKISATVCECDDIQNFADEAAELSWDLLTMVPPLVSAQPETSLVKKWHEPEQDSWQDEEDYELVYYRPVLFRSSAGAIARQGVVGNRKRNVQNKTDTHPEDSYVGTGGKEPEVVESRLRDDIQQPASTPLQPPELQSKLPDDTHPAAESIVIKTADLADDQQPVDCPQELSTQQKLDSASFDTAETENVVESSDQNQQPAADISVSLQLPTPSTSTSATDHENPKTWEVLPPNLDSHQKKLLTPSSCIVDLYQGASYERASVHDNSESQPQALDLEEPEAVTLVIHKPEVDQFGTAESVTECVDCPKTESVNRQSRVSRDTTIGLIIGSILTPIGLLFLLFLYLLYKIFTMSTQKCFVPI